MLALAVLFPLHEYVITASGVVNSFPGASIHEKFCGFMPVWNLAREKGLFSMISLWFPEYMRLNAKHSPFSAVQSGLSRNTALLWNELETPQVELISVIPDSRWRLVTPRSLAQAPSNDTMSQFASGRSNCRLARFLTTRFSFVPFVSMQVLAITSHPTNMV